MVLNFIIRITRIGVNHNIEETNPDWLSFRGEIRPIIRKKLRAGTTPKKEENKQTSNNEDSVITSPSINICKIIIN